MMMKLATFALTILVAPTSSGQTSAAAAPTSAVAMSDMCEIHVWAAEKLNTLTEGAIWNNTLNSALPPAAGKTRERAVPAGRLEPDGQMALLRELELDKVLRHPGATIVFHNGPSMRRSSGTVTRRQTSSMSRCYVEFTVAKNFFNRSGLAERTLRSLFAYDDFSDQAVPQRSFMSWASTELQIFPAKKPELVQAADEELAKAFRSNTVQFAQYAFAPRQKR